MVPFGKPGGSVRISVLVNAQLDPVEGVMREVVQAAEDFGLRVVSGRDLPLYGMLRYHLGWAESDFRSASFDPGKRIRPLICLLTCSAAGGDVTQAVPTAAAIELLHNFTLVHDDIQDRSRTRRHRPAVWTLWGDAQAINAGDALFALSQLAVLKSIDHGVSPERIVRISSDFNATTLRIAEGQVLDLGFENRWDISVDDYLNMIGGKTAAIVGFAAWAGAIIAGSRDDVAEQFRLFGRTLGLGFQVRDDLLGIWGRSEITGKPAADDIRRRKKSFPIIALAAAVTPSELAELESIYADEAVGETAVDRVLELLARYGIEDQIQEQVDHYHDEARAVLGTITEPSAARDALDSLLDRLAVRVS
jgi:geranylgeranyl diphosphate synthase type I